MKTTDKTKTMKKGIYLYIHNRIIEKHDEHRGLESKLGKESTFYFTILLNHINHLFLKE